MTEFDDLRRFADDADEDSSDDDADDYGGALADVVNQRLFLGMTPVERMFISMFVFMNVAVLGIALLLATGRI